MKDIKTQKSFWLRWRGTIGMTLLVAVTASLLFWFGWTTCQAQAEGLIRDARAQLNDSFKQTADLQWSLQECNTNKSCAVCPNSQTDQFLSNDKRYAYNFLIFEEPEVNFRTGWSREYNMIEGGRYVALNHIDYAMAKHSVEMIMELDNSTARLRVTNNTCKYRFAQNATTGVNCVDEWVLQGEIVQTSKSVIPSITILPSTTETNNEEVEK